MKQISHLIGQLRFPCLGLSMLLGIIAPTWANPESGQGKDPGQVLFQKHGCANCHGADGATTVSRYVPVLKGKSAEYITENALAIFRGERKQATAQLMHKQFCSERTDSGECKDAPPLDDLKAIANWLDSGKSIGPEKTTPYNLYYTSREAYEVVTKSAKETLLVDVRTPAEVTFIGLPKQADASIPYLFVSDWMAWDDKRKTVKLEANSYFLKSIEEALSRKGLNKESRIILICRSGDRSAKAANLLYLAGFKQIYSVTDGFEGDTAKDGPRKGERVVNGWKNNELPWTYVLDQSKLFWRDI
jgi:rhodanese-related sulfurtransferase/cytochrome c553